MPVAKEQIRQIISEKNINSVADVYTSATGRIIGRMSVLSFSSSGISGELYIRLIPIKNYADIYLSQTR